MSEQPPEEQLEAQTGVDPVVLLVLSVMLLCGGGVAVVWSGGEVFGPTLSGRVASVAGVAGVLLGAVLLYRAVKRLHW
ncbi:MAG: hypothetical protein F4X54_02705 [Chloroflexi bacterium]|nr:hypothetical protein [Chloroflexota bacterium]MYB83655.1 hypothetical protein [Chloroflexota bacterium]